MLNWNKDAGQVERTFKQLLQDPRIDKNGYCLEEYLNENDMVCMVKIGSKEFGKNYNISEGNNIMQKITTCLWFDNQAEDAVNFYTSVFKNSKIGTTTRYDDNSAKAAHMPAGSVLTVTFELEGRQFMALNGGPAFKFNESVSLVVNCEDQKEIDYYWNKLTSEGGEESMCGWLKDKYGLSWQIVPAELEKLMSNKEDGKWKRVMAEVLKMKKLDINVLRNA